MSNNALSPTGDTMRRQRDALADLARIALTQPLPRFLNEAAHIISAAVRVSHVTVWRLSPDSEWFTMIAGYGWQPGSGKGRRVPNTLATQPGYALASDGPLLLTTFQKETAKSAPCTMLQAHGVTCGVTVAVRGGKRVYGALAAHDQDMRPFAEDDITFLQATAEIIGGAMMRDADEGLLRERAWQADLLERELNGLSYAVAHELRTPVRAIDGFSSALSEDYAPMLDERGLDYLDRVQRAAQRLHTHIDDMLRLSRITRMELQPDEIDLSSVAGTIRAELELADPNRQVSWNLQAGLRVTGDKRLMRLLLEHLLGNAWKFTAGVAGARIGLKLTEVNGEIAFVVYDNGVGFDMAYADRLFSPFQRLHPQDAFPGRGMGLALVQRVINRHGGRIWTHAEPRNGAHFYFVLPDMHHTDHG